MNKRALFSLALAFLAFPVSAQEVANPLSRLLSLNAETPDSLSLKARSASFSALGGLPADTDSFMAVNKLGELIDLLQLDSGAVPGIELANELDCFAVGLTGKSVQDLQRLQPLFQVFSSSQHELAESWGKQAEAAAARAIVAVVREQNEADGARLVQATEDFHLAPIYVTLTAAPGGQNLLKQLAMLPLMLPMGMDAPVEMTVRSGWRGFCVRGDKVDLSTAELAPEHEQQILANLQKARLYVLARVSGNSLSLVICSHPDEVQIPARAENSLLASPRMAEFDACLKRDARAVGYSSPEVVKLREESDLFAYRNAADFMQRVFASLGKENETCAAAAAAVKSLLDMVAAVLPSRYGAERVMVWKEDALCLHLVSESDAPRFVPGSLRFYGLSHHPETAIYAETTPLVSSGVSVDVPAVLNHVESVQKGYLATIRPEHAADAQEGLQRLQAMRPAWEKLAAGVQKLGASLRGSAAVLVREHAEPAPGGAGIYARADVENADRAREIGNTLESGCAELCGAETQTSRLVVNDSTLMLNSAGAASPLETPAGNAVAAAGSVVAVQVPSLARGMAAEAAKDKDTELAEAAEAMLKVSRYVQRMEAAATSSEGRSSVLLRVYQPSSH